MNWYFMITAPFINCIESAVLSFEAEKANNVKE